eukprot:s2412_g4.t1
MAWTDRSELGSERHPMYSTQNYEQPQTQPAGPPYAYQGYQGSQGHYQGPYQGPPAGHAPPQGPYGGYGQVGNMPHAQGQPGAQQAQPQKGALGFAMNPDWSQYFFAASCSIMLGSFIGGLCLFFSFELVDFLETCYLMLFGGVLALMDTPCFKTMKTVKDHREYFSKYIGILTRVTGKGIAFLFLGCSLFSTLWDNLESTFMKFLAFVLCVLPMLVGVAALVIGFIKSQKLNKAREALASQISDSIGTLYDQYARTYPGLHGGLTMVEFGDLTDKLAGFKWEDTDLKLIFNALVSNPAWRANATGFGSHGGQTIDLARIPREDLLGWVRGGIVWL